MAIHRLMANESKISWVPTKMIESKLLLEIESIQIQKITGSHGHEHLDELGLQDSCQVCHQHVTFSHFLCQSFGPAGSGLGHVLVCKACFCQPNHFLSVIKSHSWFQGHMNGLDCRIHARFATSQFWGCNLLLSTQTSLICVFQIDLLSVHCFIRCSCSTLILIIC